MSWFTRSIANTFQLDNDDDSPHPQKPNDDVVSPSSPTRGVKEDFSEITKTLTTKLWGVASFLAPPPPSDEKQHADPDDPDPDPVSGIRRDFAEIGGRFRSGITKLSSNIDVKEITKLATNIVWMGPDGGEEVEVVGVSDEVLGFVRDVTLHPQTWIDFPLEEDEDDDFELSDIQQEHALAVERLAPRLAALRMELCPGYISESSFWKIYFVLLHPRLEPKAAELLSTPEIVKARASLSHELKARSNSETQENHSSVSSGTQSETVPLEISTTPLTTSVVPTDTVKTEKHPVPTESVLPTDTVKTEKHPVPTEEIQIVDKAVIKEEPLNETRSENQKVPPKHTSNVVEDKDEDEDDWLEEDSSENVNASATTTIPIENDEDVSFSDLEEDDDGDAP